MGVRRRGRELALQTIYLVDITIFDAAKAFHSISYQDNLDLNSKKFSKGLVDGVLANKAELDELIIKYAENWDLKRMAAIDRNILRLGAYELLFEQSTPISVIIDEAVELAKTYSTLDSGKFVNGILDKIKNDRKNALKTIQENV